MEMSEEGRKKESKEALPCLLSPGSHVLPVIIPFNLWWHVASDVEVILALGGCSWHSQHLGAP